MVSVVTLVSHILQSRHVTSRHVASRCSYQHVRETHHGDIVIVIDIAVIVVIIVVLVAVANILRDICHEVRASERLAGRSSSINDEYSRHADSGCSSSRE